MSQTPGSFLTNPTAVFLGLPQIFKDLHYFWECRLPKQGFHMKTGSNKKKFFNWFPLNFWKQTLFIIFPFALLFEMLGSFMPACNPQQLLIFKTCHTPDMLGSIGAQYNIWLSNFYFATRGPTVSIGKSNFGYQSSDTNLAC